MNKEINKNINSWILDENNKRRKLLDSLALELWEKFSIDKKEALKLIKNNTFKSLDDLKQELEKNNSKIKLSEKDIENLYISLKWAKELITNVSEIKIKTLKETIENYQDNNLEEKINIEEFKNKLEKILPEKLINKAKNPQYIHEHILWFSLGTANSIIAIADLVFQIWAWIIKSPYHIYLIISWKWELDWYKDI